MPKFQKKLLTRFVTSCRAAFCLREAHSCILAGNHIANARRASRSGHEALAMEVLHSIQTGSRAMPGSRNWCSGAHGCNEGRDMWQHLRARA